MILLSDTNKTIYLQRHDGDGIGYVSVILTNTLNGDVHTIDSIYDSGDTYKYKLVLPEEFVDELAEGEYLLTIKRGGTTVQKCMLRYGTFVEQGDITYEG